MPPRHRYLRLVGLLLTAMLGLSGPTWANTKITRLGGGATCANPTATIGLTAVNGVATTCLRSDGAPALSQAIAPTWTALHTFGAGLTLTSGQLLVPNGTSPLPSLSFANFPGSGFSAGVGSTTWNVDGVGYYRLTSDEVQQKSSVAFAWSSGALGAPRDLKLLRDAAGVLRLEGASSGAGSIKLSSDANASYARITHATELHTLALAATSDTTLTTPANSLVVGVVIRVTTTITGTTSLDIGVAGAPTRYGTGIALTAGTTHRSPGTTSPSIYSAATAIRFSAGVTESFTAGVVRVTISYLDLSAPTSGLTLEQQAERGLPLAA